MNSQQQNQPILETSQQPPAILGLVARQQKTIVELKRKLELEQEQARASAGPRSSLKRPGAGQIGD